MKNARDVVKACIKIGVDQSVAEDLPMDKVVKEYCESEIKSLQDEDWFKWVHAYHWKFRKLNTRDSAYIVLLPCFFVRCYFLDFPSTDISIIQKGYHEIAEKYEIDPITDKSKASLSHLHCWGWGLLSTRNGLLQRVGLKESFRV